MNFKEGISATGSALIVAASILGCIYISSVTDKNRRQAETEAASRAAFKAIPAVYSLDSTYRARIDSLEYQQYSLGKQYSSQRDSLRKVYASYIEKIVGGK
jgi:hypothetical protein